MVVVTYTKRNDLTDVIVSTTTGHYPQATKEEEKKAFEASQAGIADFL